MYCQNVTRFLKCEVIGQDWKKRHLFQPDFPSEFHFPLREKLREQSTHEKKEKKSKCENGRGLDFKTRLVTVTIKINSKLRHQERAISSLAAGVSFSAFGKELFMSALQEKKLGPFHTKTSSCGWARFFFSFLLAGKSFEILRRRDFQLCSEFNPKEPQPFLMPPSRKSSE